MKNLKDSEIQAVSGGFVVEAAAAAYLSSSLATSGVHLLSAIIPPLAALEPLSFLGDAMIRIAPIAGVAAYTAWHFSSQDTKEIISTEFNRTLADFQA